ncbi:MAG: DUF799 family lipoprotein [Proteobacteria bacterium]|nr:DUF799 family lipoprotein [Pseudomonadota bacterium]
MSLKGKRKFIVLLIIFSLSGCSSLGPTIRPNPANPIRTVAVLPMYNLTNNLDGAEYVRERFTEELSNRQYVVMDTAEVTSILQEQTGITLGSQLEMTSPEVIGEILGVDALVYGYLLDFDDIILGVYNARVVRAAFKAVNVRSGKLMWSNAKGFKFVIFSGDLGLLATIAKELVDSGESFETVKGLEDISGLNDWTTVPVPVESIENAAILTLGALVIGKAFGVHLHHESNVMIEELTRNIPAGPGN